MPLQAQRADHEGAEKLSAELSFGLLDLLAMLRKRHAEGWAYMENVGEAKSRKNCASSVAVSLRGSQGFTVHFFDVRDNRTQWLAQVNAGHWQEQYSDFCWVVAAPGVVMPQELPQGWGLLVPHIKRTSRNVGLDGVSQRNPLADYTLNEVVAANKRASAPIPREFLGKLMSSATQDIAGKVQSINHAQNLKMRAELDRKIKEAETNARRENRNLVEKIEEFKEKTGIDLRSRYDVPSVSAIRIAQALERFGPIGTMEILSGLDRIAANLNENARLVSQTADDIRENISEAQQKPLTRRLPGFGLGALR